MLTEKLYKSVVENATGQALNGIWACFQVKGGVPELDQVAIDVYGFEACEETFFEILERLMREGVLKLAKHGQFLQGSIDQQIQFFRDSFPVSDQEVDMGGAGVWFFTEACPGGAVWILEDGTEVWT